MSLHSSSTSLSPPIFPFLKLSEFYDSAAKTFIVRMCLHLQKFYFIGIFRKQSKVAKHQNFFFSKKFYCRNRNTCRSDRFCSNLKKSFFVSPLAFQLEHSFDFIVSTALASFEALPQFHLEHCFDFIWSIASVSFEALLLFHIRLEWRRNDRSSVWTS